MLQWLRRHPMSAMAVAGGLGAAYAVYSSCFAEPAVTWRPWKVSIYRALPLRPLSRVWGKVHSYEIPAFLRRPILGAYVRWYKCDLGEAERTDLRTYSSLQEFFCRPVRSDLRPISELPVVSPGDGLVQWCGPVEDGHLIQVKGISYPLGEFFGTTELHGINLNGKSQSLWSCILYLAPGDYHGFHSPADWQISFRRHVSGYLLSVGQRIVRRVRSLYCLNERVHLMGRWRHGFFSLCAVGATNVGSIRIIFEDDLKTNRANERLGSRSDHVYEPAFLRRKGEKLGEFKLGSSIVLVFEAPPNFQFTVAAGDRVKYGETLGLIA